MRSILAGIETEYGLLIEGRGAQDQIDDAMDFVRGYPGKAFVGWDYRHESPRADLRGFRLERLAVDPIDAKFDVGKSHGGDREVRSDRVLPNGARFYNDHGHPEYSTPECWSLTELALHDRAGQIVLQRAAYEFAERSGLGVSVYKNNTDFHGSSYGTHESYLIPRAFGFDALLPGIMPMLVVRQILTGAGKVGAETGRSATFQLSQRADFFVEPANAETLYRRPIFNTRDEPHASQADWIRMHVISGDANMMPGCTARKVGLVKLAIHLLEAGIAPIWKLSDPVVAFQNISRDESLEFKIALEGNSWTTGYEILESYFAAAEHSLELDDELKGVINTSRELLADIRSNSSRFKRSVDWAAKKFILEQYMAAEGTDWRDPALASYDLEYHNVDRKEGLYSALLDMGEVEPEPSEADLMACLQGVNEPTRAYARGIAIQKFSAAISSVCWRSITFLLDGEHQEVELWPDGRYSAQLGAIEDVETFIEMLKSVRPADG